MYKTLTRLFVFCRDVVQLAIDVAVVEELFDQKRPGETGSSTSRFKLTRLGMEMVQRFSTEGQDFHRDMDADQFIALAQSTLWSGRPLNDVARFNAEAALRAGVLFESAFADDIHKNIADEIQAEETKERKRREKLEQGEQEESRTHFKSKRPGDQLVKRVPKRGQSTCPVPGETALIVMRNTPLDKTSGFVFGARSCSVIVNIQPMEKHGEGSSMVSVCDQFNYIFF